ncbi:MAG: hypothetical protein B7Y70_10065, partial [Rhizobiales bacterium 35-68-8]
MARGGVKALYVLAALASGVAPLSAQAPGAPLTGYAGSGTADPVPPRAGEGAPPHLTGEAPHPGDAAGTPRAGDRAEAPAASVAPVAVIVELPPAPATPTGLDAPQQAAEARAEAAAEERQHVGHVQHVKVDPPADAASAASPAVPVVVELPPAPAMPTGLDAHPAPVSPPARAVAEQPADPLAPIAAAIARQLAAPASGREPEAIAAFYGARSDAPVFVDQKGYTARGKAMIARFEAAGEDGLDPAAYKFTALPVRPDAEVLAQA